MNGATGGDPASGRIAGLAADPTDPNTIYIAAAGGGVWKTTDGGTNWTPLTDSQSTLFMGAIALAPSDPNTIYAGTGETTDSLLSFYGRGVLKSTDAGASWTLLGNTQFNRKSISQIVVSPLDPNTVYVAVGDYGINGVSGGTGIWRSTDGGKTWANTTTRISTTAAFSDVQMDPQNPQLLYAAVGYAYGDSANGVYKTINGGTSWSLVSGLPSGTGVGNTKIAIAPTDDQTIYVAVAGSGVGNAFGNLFRMMKSVDGGQSWTQLTMTPASNPLATYLNGQGWYDLTLAVDPLSANTVYTAGVTVIRSQDGGGSWSNINLGSNGRGPHVDHHGIGFDAAGRLLDGNDGGIWRLDNQAPVRWSDLNGNLNITQFIGIDLNPTDPNIALGGTQDNGLDRFLNSSGWTQTDTGDAGDVLFSPTNPLRVYHVAPVGSLGTNNFLRRSDDGGLHWQSAVKSVLNGGDPMNFYPPLIIDPADGNHLFLGTNRLYETTDGANSWSAISTPSANGWVGAAAIDSVAFSPTAPNTIYVADGGDSGSSWRIFVTTNHGASWTQRTLPLSGHINELQVDPSNSQIVYAVRDEFNGGHVYRTINGGANWVDISGNLPNLPTYAIVVGAGGLYVGNDDGVYFSTNSGTSWSRLGDGLPHAQVRQLVLNSNLGILGAGTHGRGLWELSGIGLASHFSVTSSASSLTAGTTLQLTVTAVDDQNSRAAGYMGTIHFTSTDAGATLPADYTLTAADAGRQTFTVSLIQAGGQTVTVTDLAAITGSVSLGVNPAAADHFSVSAPVSSTAGVPFDVTITALDPFNNIDSNYQGTVHFASTDASAAVVLPPDTSFTSGDGGVHTFSAGVTLVTAGSQTLAVADTVLGNSGAVSVTVSAAAPDHLLLSAPDMVLSGMAFDVAVTVQDAFNNPVLTYLGTVQFASTDADPGVILPPDYAFTSDDAGMHTFVAGVTLFTVGSQTITVSDASAGVLGTAVVNVVAPGAPPGGGGRANHPQGGPFPTRPSDLDTNSVSWFFATSRLDDRTMGGGLGFLAQTPRKPGTPRVVGGRDGVSFLARTAHIALRQ